MTELELDEHDMQFGIFSMPERWPWDNWTLSFDRIKEEARRYDKLGFDEIWYGEHHTGGYENIPAPEILVANIAPYTENIRLATGVIAAPYHDPFKVAERITFLHQLTKGRYIAGIGGSGIPSDQWLFSPNDFDSETQQAKTNEAIDIIQTYVDAEEPTSYHGEFWQYEDRIVQIPPYDDDLEIGMPGMTSLNTFNLGGREGLITISPMFNPITQENNPDFPSITEMMQELVRSAERAGRDPKEVRKNWRLAREVYVAESKEQAIEDILAGANQSYNYLKGLGLGDLFKSDVDMHDDDVTVEWMIENVPWIIGSPEDCIKQIKALYEELGGFGGLLFVEHDWVPSYKAERSAELLAREVMPAFKHKRGPRDWILDQLNYSSPEPEEDVFEIENSTPRLTGWEPTPGNEYSLGELDL